MQSSNAKMTFNSSLRGDVKADASVIINIYAGSKPDSEKGVALKQAAWVDGSNRIRLPQCVMNVVRYDRPSFELVTTTRWHTRVTETIPPLPRLKQLFTMALFAIGTEVSTRATVCNQTEFYIDNAATVFYGVWKELLQIVNIRVTLHLHGFTEYEHEVKPIERSNDRNYDERQPNFDEHESNQKPRHHNNKVAAPAPADAEIRNEQIEEARRMAAAEADEPADATEQQLKELLAKSTSPTPAKPKRKKVATS